jgi:hypothetical protein
VAASGQALDIDNNSKCYECLPRTSPAQDKGGDLLARLAEHETKVRMEEIKDEPDQELIKHWKAEISAFGKSIERARRRLGR